MKIILSKNEFNALLKFVSECKNKDIIEYHNNVFNCDSKVKGFANPITKEVEIHIPDREGTLILSCIADNASEVGVMIKNDLSITSIPKWVNIGNTILTNIKKLLN